MSQSAESLTRDLNMAANVAELISSDTPKAVLSSNEIQPR